ncbi:MAG: choline ABC transporter ATP-binding protein [Pseudomonadota bacterium]
MSNPTRPIVQFDNVDIVFGDSPKSALPLVDQHKTRAEIQELTGQVLGVAGCSLDVHQGEIVVLMGLSGSGKSTLLRAVNGLNPVIRGECRVAMDDAATQWANPQSCPRRTLRKLRQERVAMVFQQFGLLPWRTVRENVGFGLEISGTGKTKRATAIDEQLNLVGLGDWGDRRVQELSGGMQQRVGLARAFATQAPVLLMDEPFSALDPLIRDKLQDDLLELQSRLKRTIIFVSHDLDEALKLGNRIAIMEGGRIIQTGTAQEIILNPASEYVAEFVAHMNPLSVLRAAEVMVTRVDDAPADTIPIEQATQLGQCPRAAPQTPLKEIMRAQVDTGSTVFVADGNTIIGRIDKDDIIKALVNQ